MADIFGDADPNDLDGTAEADTIQAREGDDKLRGKAGADTLLGGTDDDTLRGGNGADTLKDGFGIDRFFGGRGADIFEFVRLEGLGGRERDIVCDFKDGIDRIDLRQVTANFGDLSIVDTARGHVRIAVGDRVILVKDHDGTLDAADIGLADFIV